MFDDVIEDPSDNGPTGEAAAEDQAAQGAKPNGCVHPVMQLKIFHHHRAAADAGDDGADEADRPFAFGSGRGHQHHHDSGKCRSTRCSGRRSSDCFECDGARDAAACGIRHRCLQSEKGAYSAP